MFEITALELNFLIYRYFQGSGFTHSAFMLECEAGLSNCPIDGNNVPPQALIKCIQKGLQYIELEANLENCKLHQDEDFSFIRPMDLITKNVSELRQMIQEGRENRPKNVVKVVNWEPGARSSGVSQKGKEEVGQKSGSESEGSRKDHAKRRGRKSAAAEGMKWFPDYADTEIITEHEDKELSKDKDIEMLGGTRLMNTRSTPTPYACGVPGVDVTILEGHAHEVCACAWTPTGSLLASGSADSTARIWNMDMIYGGNSGSGNPYVRVLEHAKGRPSEHDGITSIDWNGDGSLLATASYDGHARIWTSDGELKSTLRKHKGAVLTIRWNRKGDYVLTGSLDTTAIVWDVKTNDLKQHFELHSGQVIDTDWRNNASFAASTDKLIHVCEIGTKCPVKTYNGHEGEVNSIRWDPSGSLLASGSDDTTLKIWSLKQDNYIHDFRGHRKGVLTSRWSPTGQGTSNPNKPVVLASASFDSTVKMWDVEQGKLLCNFDGHRDAVYSIAFSPDGEYLASGSKDKCLNIWSVKTGEIVRSYVGEGTIFEVCWNKEGNKVAACNTRNQVVMDFRM